MALTRKYLAALGIDADKIDEIINAHAETVNGLKEEAEKYREDADKYSEAKKELDSLKKTAGNYAELRREFDAYKADVEEKAAKAAKEKAYREALKDANLSEKGIEKALKYADWAGVEVDDNGTLKNAKELVKAAREEWAEYIVKAETKGAKTSNPPGGAGGSKLTRDDIYKTDDSGRFIMDAQDRQKALAELLASEHE